MNARPLLLDLFCGAGGAAKGYYRAGFDVIGVDIEPQPHYPYRFVQADVMTYLSENMRRVIDTVDAIHASPPCQWSSTLTQGTNAYRRELHTNLIPQTRRILDAIGKPYIIENVQGSEVRRDATLCGEMFGLGVIRHRYFESNTPLHSPPHRKHRGRVAGWRHGEYFDGPYFAVYGDGGGKGSIAQWQTAMGIDWMTTRHELAESIPPAYTEHLGHGLIREQMNWD